MAFYVVDGHVRWVDNARAMSRRVCETCSWFLMSDIVDTGGYGICVRHRDYTTPYEARQLPMYPIIAANQIRCEEDSCKHWERDDRESWKR